MSEKEVVGDLEEIARKRKERLEALKKCASTDTDGAGMEEPILPAPVFRNYNPSDESLKELKKQKAIPTTVEEIVEEIPSEKKSPSEEVDLANLSKKVDWDLKRIIEKPVHKLERRTQRAIAELIRERIAGEIREDNATSLQSD